MIQGRLALAERAHIVSRKHRQQYYAAIESRWKKTTLQSVANTATPPCSESNDLPHDSRVMDISNLATMVEEVSSHSASCRGACKMDGELQHAGLAVVIRLACEKCAKQFRLHLSKQVDTADGKRWLVNLAAVLGQLATGGGTSALSRMLLCMGIPDMPKSIFTATERLLGKNMAQLLELSIAEAGEEERKLAIQRKDYHQGVPAITVIADGGWSKRSH